MYISDIKYIYMTFNQMTSTEMTFNQMTCNVMTFNQMTSNGMTLPLVVTEFGKYEFEKRKIDR